MHFFIFSTVHKSQTCWFVKGEHTYLLEPFYVCIAAAEKKSIIKENQRLNIFSIFHPWSVENFPTFSLIKPAIRNILDTKPSAEKNDQNGNITILHEKDTKESNYKHVCGFLAHNLLQFRMCHFYRYIVWRTVHITLKNFLLIFYIHIHMIYTHQLNPSIL